MQQLFQFFNKRRHFFLFTLILIVAFLLTVQNQDYQKSRFVNSANDISGKVYTISNEMKSYLDLKEKNKRLLEENAKMRSMLKSSMKEISKHTKIKVDTIINIVQKYNYTSADVIHNSFNNRNNYIVINKGYINGIKSENAVITSNGILGIVESVSEHYSSIISILNKKTRINAKLKKSNYFGSLSWIGNDRSILTLEDVPKQAIVNVGDTVTTGGYSSIFPKGLNIGYVESYNIPKGENYYIIKVKTFVDYANINSVYIIDNLHKEEIKKIEY